MPLEPHRPEPQYCAPIGWLLERIRYAALEIVCEPLEHLLVLDPKSGGVIHRVTGTEDAVKVDPGLTRDMVVMHNHPSELTFSGDDIAVSAEQNCALAVVVTHGMLGFLERPEAGWPSPNGIYLDSFLEGIIKDGLLNEINAIRDGSIHTMAANIGAFYWCEYCWMDNLIDGKN